MNKFILPVLILSAVLFVSCDDSLNPKADFAEEYVLYGVIRADTTFQTVYLSRSYSVDGYDASENTTDPAIQGATVKLTVNNKTVYTLAEGSTTRTDTSRYSTSFSYYYIDNYKPKDEDEIEITATLSNGVVLKSSSVVPPISYLYYETSTTVYNPTENLSGNMSSLSFAWKFLTIQDDDDIYYFLPRLEINYYKTENPDVKLKVKVPLYFLTDEGTSVPIYPTVSNKTSAVFDYDSIVNILNSISEGDDNKGNYIIDRAEFTLLFVDKNLAAYLASENTFADEFSVRVDAADFSNIDGGLGLFGSVAIKKTKVTISKLFIQDFGYKTTY